MLRSAVAFVLVASTAPVLAQGSDSIASLLHREDVQAELRLTTDQIKRWKEIDRAPKTKHVGAFETDQFLIEDPQLVRARDNKRESRAWGLLSPSQTVRLHELYVQRVGVLAVLREDVQRRLELSESQSQEARMALAAYDMSVRNLIKKQQSVKSEIGRLDPKKLAEALHSINRDTVERLDAVLTNDQRTRLKETGGKPFRFLERKFGG